MILSKIWLNNMANNREITIGNKHISDGSDCFVIAEIGHNHQGDVETCKRLFEAAKFCGVDAVKLQKRNNRSLYTKKFFNSAYNSEQAFGQTYGLHRQALEFSKKQYKLLKRYAEKLGLIFFATAFDHKSADFLDELGVVCFKIASADIVNLPLLTYVAKKGKPMVVSTGGATISEVNLAHRAINNINSDLVLMQCTSVYPAPADLLDLRVIETYRRKFPTTVIGLSNHFNGISVDPVAYSLGARVVEKHFTLDRAMKGSDHAFSLEPVGMRKLVRDLKRIRLALGDGVKKFYEEEKAGIYKMGKCIVAAKNLPVGHLIKSEDLAFKSPFEGIAPRYATKFIGKKLKVSLKRDQAFSLVHV